MLLFLGSRLEVGHAALDRRAGVRILPPQPIQVSPYYLLKTYIAQPRVSLPYNRYSVFALFILFNNSELSGSSGLTVT